MMPIAEVSAAAAEEAGHVNLCELYRRGVNDGLEKAARACEYEAVMFDIFGAHATAKRLARICRQIASGGEWPDHPSNASHDGPGAASSRTVPLDAAVGGAVPPAPPFKG